MAMILPPQQPNDPRVTLPVNPANPPTLADLNNAQNYRQNVVASAGSHHVSSATPGEVGRAMAYEHSLTHVVSAAALGVALAPPWFAPVQRQLNRMEMCLCKTVNSANGDGSIYEYQIVLFVDETDPTGHPHNLPHLTSVAVINTLSTVHAQRYLIGYGIQNITGGVNARRRLVKIAIGCKVA
ncbi:hypothetical protein D9615_005141 [Tricholomella constricta]|uniref:Mug135-like C-terminal domain-containing protein n=1 Tax=Tricholomella constricta TaxID=117010 RepID=A0A8H5H6H4_9AGAR|nr:hypothetical protein D9615_005141 [Tricholomella constricta]